MKVCLRHVKNDSTSQCARRIAPEFEGSCGRGRHVAVGLSASGNQRNRRKTNARRITRPLAQAQAHLGTNRYRSAGTRRTRSAMIVLDASAAVDWLLQTSSGQRIERRIYAHSETLHAPHLLDLEIIQVLRRLTLRGVVSAKRADEAVRDLVDLRLTRYPHLVLLPRIWQLRHNFAAYDAAYIVLAEKLGAPLITRDGRLASTSGHRAIIELF